MFSEAYLLVLVFVCVCKCLIKACEHLNLTYLEFCELKFEGTRVLKDLDLVRFWETYNTLFLFFSISFLQEAEVVRFEMDEEKLAQVTQSLNEIEERLSTYTQ